MPLSPEDVARYNAMGAVSQGGGSEEKGIGSHVLDVLGLFDRPRNALATAVQEGLSEDPEQSFVGGLGRGITGEKQTSWGDVVGLGEATSEQDWPEWLARSAGHLGLNIVGDPLTYLFAPAKLAGGARYPARALVAGLGVPEGRSIAGLAASAARLPELGAKIEEASGLGKLFRRGTGEPITQQLYDREMWGKNELRQVVDKHVEDIKKLRTEHGVGPERDIDLFSALQSEGQRLPEDINPNVYHAYRPLQEMQAAQLAEENALRIKRGWEPIEDISAPGYSYLSQIRADLPGQTQPAKRTLVKFVDDMGNEPVPGYVGNAKNLEELAQRGIYKDKQGGYYHYSDPNKPIFPSPQTNLADIYESGAMPKGSFIEDPAEAMRIRLGRGQTRIGFLRFMDKAEESGQLMDLRRASMPTQTLGHPANWTIPEGWRLLKIDGLEHYAAPQRLANFMENQAHMGAVPDSTGGKIAEFFDKAMDTWAGGKVTQFNTWFKRNVLTSPGRYIGDIMSRPSQQYQDAEVLAHMIPVRMSQALKIGKDLGEPVFAGIPNEVMQGEAIARELFGRDVGALYGLQETQRRGGQGFIRGMLGADNPITKGAEKWGDLNDWILAKGRFMEGLDRTAVFVDRLKGWEAETGQQIAQLKLQNPEAYTKLLDEAARFSHDRMIDFTRHGHLPFDRSMSQVFPFWHWIRGILGRELQTMINRPQRVARAGRFYDALLQPMSPEDKEISDEYIKEQGPTMGIAGTSWDDIMEKMGSPGRAEGQRMMLLGRFMPQTHFEQLYHRPGEFMGASTSPVLKTVPNLIRNFDDFRSAPIDPIAGGFPANIVNPLIGKPYQGAQRTRFGAELPAGWDYALAQSPAGRHTGELSELVRGAWSSLGGENLDPYKSETDFTEALASTTSGRKIYPWDRAKQLSHREREWSERDRAIKRAEGWAGRKGADDAADRYRELHEAHMLRKPGNMLMEGQ